MIPPLNEMVGLPPATSLAELGSASERRFQTVLGRASLGDANAQIELVRLRVAYLNWAYASQPVQHLAVRSCKLSTLAVPVADGFSQATPPAR